MPFPLIFEYVEAIKAAKDNFEELTNLRPVLGDDGQPVMTSGNFAVVFKMQDIETGKFYALKCFTRDQEGRVEAYHQIADALKDVDSPYLVSFRYMDKELFVDTEQTAETEFPVLLMDWVEGKTLDKYLRENLDDKYALEMLAYRFSQLAQWLIPQPFAHGDLKPDNILVCEDGTLVLVDYDGMYVPAMKGQKARELGSPDFRHPLRTENDFDEHIDDFPLISILLSLKLVAYDSRFWGAYGASDRLLFSQKDYTDFSNSKIIKDVFPSDNQTINCLISIYSLCYYERKIEVSLIDKLDTDIINFLSTKITDADISNKYIDKFGAEYSIDLKRLFKIGEETNNEEIPNFNGVGGYFVQVVSFELENGVRVICDYAFQDALNFSDRYVYAIDLNSLNFNNIWAIGDFAFRGLLFVGEFELSSNLLYVGRDPFALTDYLIISSCSSPNLFIDGFALYTKDGEKLIHEYDDSLYWYRIPDGVKTIGEYSFSRKTFDASMPHYIYIPDSVERIEDNAFMNYNLCGIRMPSNIKYLGDSIFKNCYNLQELYIPEESFDQYYKLLPNLKDHFRVESNYLEGCDKEKINLYCLKDFCFSIDTSHILKGCTDQSVMNRLQPISISEEQFEDTIQYFLESISPISLVDINSLLPALFTIEVASLWLPNHLQGRMFACATFWDKHYAHHDAILYGIEGEFSKKLKFDIEIEWLREYRGNQFVVAVLCKILSIMGVSENFCNNINKIIDIINNNRRREKTRIRLGDDFNCKDYKKQEAIDLKLDLKYLNCSRKIVSSIKKKVALDDIANAQGLDFDELLNMIEVFVNSGDKLDITYFLKDVMDEKDVDNIYKYFEKCDNYSLNEALINLGKYSEEEIRLVRIQYLSDNCSTNSGHMYSLNDDVSYEIADDDLPF